MHAKVGQPHWTTVVLVLTGVGLAVALGLATRHLTDKQSEELLQRRANEVTALLVQDIGRVQATLHSLRPIAETDPGGRTFEASASPHLRGRVRAIAALRPVGDGFDVVAVVGDGLPDPTSLDATRIGIAARALESPELVSGIVIDEWRRRIVIAEGPAPGGPNLVLWYESTVDPNLPNPSVENGPYSDLNVAMYASPTVDPDALILTTAPDWDGSGAVAEVEIPVGRDRWLVRVASTQSPLGPVSEHMPEVAFGAVFLAAMAAGFVAEVLGRRRDYALGLVEERTNELRHALDRAEQAQQELAHRVLYDPLTGLPTRTLLGERLRHAIARSKRSQVSFALIFCDLDRFKLVNDSLGHSAGDRLLHVVAQRIERAARDVDTVARFGGDEFVVLCENIADIDEAAAVAHRIADELRAPLVIHGQQLSVTASLGVALGQDETDPDLLLRRADTAMYRAKEKGRDQIEIFAEHLGNRTEELFHTEQALRAAIVEGALEVHYQPIVELRDADLTAGGPDAMPRPAGFEALIRWPKGDGTYWLPDRFIPMAEETGLVVPLDRFVLREACRFTVEINEAHPDQLVTMSVNLSARDLAAPGTVEAVAEVLAETGLDPSLLWLELTESGIVENLEDGRDTLLELRRLGVRIAVDDFGTGWSSLMYLRQLPVDVLKIDRAFVSGVDRSFQDRAIVSAVVTLAESLGMGTVAEGVEEELQAEVLRDLGCVRGQGYYWSKPLREHEARALIARTSPAPPQRTSSREAV